MKDAGTRDSITTTSPKAPNSPNGLLSRLRNYKPEHGRYVRLTCFWSLTALWFYGCYRLWQSLSDLRWSWASWLRTRWVDELPLVEWPLTPAVLVSVLAFLFGMAAFQMFLNRPKVADLLIETEAELRKVTWPTFRDTAGSSMVVLCTVLVMFVLLAAFDFAIGQVVDFLLYRA